jgi:hypothetical protein
MVTGVGAGPQAESTVAIATSTAIKLYHIFLDMLSSPFLILATIEHSTSLVSQNRTTSFTITLTVPIEQGVP